jgi:chorismate synthase
MTKAANHSGGTLGGMTDGAPLTMRIAIKPTPSIASTQKTVNKDGEEIDIEINGRHDPIIVPRAVVVVESMAAITILDALFENMKSKLSDVVDFYS